ncbi:MAG: group II truncated hemoglobin [Deltaproteobacteria bacterium]|nr:group II truncated hemoglobin [Deltaproteobacteria bacterium]
MTTADETPFARLGGEPGVRRLVDRFYDAMERPEVALLRQLHPPSLDGSRDKLHWYLCGWLGGPPLYTSKFGHPRLRARHFPFAIDTVARDQWLACMQLALDEQVADLELRAWLGEKLTSLADHMRNQPA